MIRLQQITLTEDQQKEIKLEAQNCFRNFQDLCDKTIDKPPETLVDYKEVVLSKKLLSQPCSHIAITD